jgi:hypothetical protein
LVSYSSIIWYGYNKVLSENAPKVEEQAGKFRQKLRGMMYPERPDMWASTIPP